MIKRHAAVVAASRLSPSPTPSSERTHLRPPSSDGGPEYDPDAGRSYGALHDPQAQPAPGLLKAHSPPSGSALEDPEGGREEDAASIAPSDAPPVWSYLRATHLLLLIPLTLVMVPLMSLPAVFAWPPPAARPPHWTAAGLGALGGLSALALRRPVLDGLAARLAGSRAEAVVAARCIAGAPLVAQTALTELIRLFVLHAAPALAPSPLPPPRGGGAQPQPPLPPPPDPFFAAFWLALGWAFAEAVAIGCVEWARQVLLYREVLLADDGGDGAAAADADADAGGAAGPRGYGSWTAKPLAGAGEEAPEALGSAAAAAMAAAERTGYSSCDGSLDDDGGGGGGGDPREEWVEALVRSRKREGLEAGLGAPLWAVPWFVVAVWRLDAALLTLATTLWLGLALSGPPAPLPPPPVAPALLAAIAARSAVTLVWSFKMARWGVPAVSYGTLLVALLAFGASLAAWGALR